MFVLLQILKMGGPVTWIILALGLIALIIMIERFLNLRRSQIDVQDFLPGIINTLRSQNIKEAVTICDEAPGPAAHVVRQAIMHSQDGKNEMYRATQEACLSELPRLERNMKLLLTIVHAAPLLGLLGTVIGLITIFYSVDRSEPATFSSLKEMAPAIWTALISSAAGLIVAIPAYLTYSLLRQQIDNILIEMEKSAVEIIYFLSEHPAERPVEEFVPPVAEEPAEPASIPAELLLEGPTHEGADG